MAREPRSPQQEIHGLKQSVTEHQSRFVQANQDLARLTSELGASRRELARAETVKGQLAAAAEKLAAACSERDALKLQVEHERRRGDELAVRLEAKSSEAQQLDSHARDLETQLAATRARQDSAEQMSEQIRNLLQTAAAKPATT